MENQHCFDSSQTLHFLYFCNCWFAKDFRRPHSVSNTCLGITLKPLQTRHANISSLVWTDPTTRNRIVQYLYLFHTKYSYRLKPVCQYLLKLFSFLSRPLRTRSSHDRLHQLPAGCLPHRLPAELEGFPEVLPGASGQLKVPSLLAPPLTSVISDPASAS